MKKKINKILSFIFNKIIVNGFFIILFFTFFSTIVVSLLISYDNTYYERLKLNNFDKVYNKDDETILNKELNSNGKDILVILDTFNYSDNHGNQVSYFFNNYIKEELNKELDFLPIYLNFNEQSPNITNIELLKNRFKNDDFYYKTILKHEYFLEVYLKKLRELNPNSKIVISLSFTKFGFNNEMIKLSKKYDIKIVQGYLNLFKYYETWYDYFFWFFYYNIFLDTTNTIMVTNTKNQPYINIKKLTLNNLNTKKLNRYYIFELSDSNSLLTPVMAYEYYLNPNSNIIINK